MKNGIWIILIAVILVACLALSIFLLRPSGPAAYAEIWSEGKMLHTLPLAVDRQITVETQLGTNVITVKGGKIAVTEASCPDHYCMHRGFCDSGLQIVCLPHKLEIRFTGQQEIDGVVG